VAPWQRLGPSMSLEASEACHLLLMRTLYGSQVMIRNGTIRYLSLNCNHHINVITIIVSKMTSHCAGTAQVRELSESGIRE